MSQKQRLIWLLSMLTSTEANFALQSFIGVQYLTRDQHQEMGKYRHVREAMDTEKV